MRAGCGRRWEQPECHPTVAGGSGSPAGGSRCIEPWAVQRTAVEEAVRSVSGWKAKLGERGKRVEEEKEVGEWEAGAWDPEDWPQRLQRSGPHR